MLRRVRNCRFIIIIIITLHIEPANYVLYYCQADPVRCSPGTKHLLLLLLLLLLLITNTYTNNLKRFSKE